MQFHFFTVPAIDSTTAQDTLNAFCASHRIVSVEREWIPSGLQSQWAFCVTITEGAGSISPASKSSRSNAATRIDYKQLLSEADFKLYADLRLWRKATAEREGVPVYAIVTNEQLAEVVTKRVTTLTAMREIPGIGPARVERYGEQLIARMQASLTPPTGGA